MCSPSVELYSDITQAKVNLKCFYESMNMRQGLSAEKHQGLYNDNLPFPTEN